MAQDTGDSILPASRITLEKHVSFVQKFMPAGAAVMVGDRGHICNGGADPAVLGVLL